MNRKYSVFLTVLVIFLTSLVPVFSQSKQFSGQSITFWMQRYGSDPANQDALMKRMTDQFEAETGAKVDVVFVDWGTALTKYTLAASGGEAPDVADTFFLASLVKIGGAKFGPMQINDVAKEIGMDRYYSGIMHEVKVGKDYYGIPWRADTRVLAYNTDMFAAAGITAPPRTWDELIADGKKLTKVDSNGNIKVAGFLWANNEARFDQTWFGVIAGAGGKVFSDDLSKPIFDSKAGIESLQFMQDMVYKYKISPKNVIDPSFDSRNEFMAEKAAMIGYLTAESRVAVEKNAPQLIDKIKVAVMPSKSGTGPSSMAYAAPVVIFKTTKNPALSKAWLKFFVREDNQLDASKSLSLLNSNKNVMADPAFKNDPWLSVYAAQFERSQMGDMPLPTWSQIDAFPSGPLATMTTLVMAGRNIPQAVAKAKAEVIKLMHR